MKIEFEVNGKPPSKSNWEDKEGLVKKFREKALAARNKVGMSEGNEHLVKIDLTVYTSNPSVRELNKGDDPSKFSGDLDGFISGVFDYLSDIKTKPKDYPTVSKYLTDGNVNCKIPLIIKDDSQIVEINARKKKSEKEQYCVKIVFLDKNLKELD